MSEPIDAISETSKITLHFALMLEDGQIVDSTFEREPATFEYGDGNLPASFEALLLGLKAGDEELFTVLPEKAFGMSNPNSIQQFRRDEFPEDMALEVGLTISFKDAKNQELPGVVKSLDGDQVEIDFNHPLAGQTLKFKVQIVDVHAG